MDLKRILRIKELESEEKARRVRELEETISRLLKEKEKYESELKFLEKLMLQTSDVMPLLAKQRSFISKIESIEKRVEELRRELDRELEKLRDLKAEEKATQILKERRDYEEYADSVKREALMLGFLHLIKKGLKVVLLISLAVHAQSAVQEKLKEMNEAQQGKRLKEIEKVIEEKLQKLQEERKRLEALRKKPLTEEEEKEVKKFIKIVSKAPADEAGAILNELDPNIAAEILLRLKERQAGQILASMDPKKAAKVTEIIMKRKKSLSKGSP